MPDTTELAEIIAGTSTMTGLICPREVLMYMAALGRKCQKPFLSAMDRAGRSGFRITVECRFQSL